MNGRWKFYEWLGVLVDGKEEMQTVMGVLELCRGVPIVGVSSQPAS